MSAAAAAAARAQRARVNERHVFTQQRAGVGGRTHADNELLPWIHHVQTTNAIINILIYKFTQQRRNLARKISNIS